MNCKTQVRGDLRFGTFSVLSLVVLCGCLTLGGQPAIAQSLDPCSQPTVGTPAGTLNNDSSGLCSAIITVTAVDTSGNAIAFNVAATGVPAYDGVEDILVGIQNNSGANLSSIKLSSPDTTFRGIFAFDGDGPCTLDPVNDCFHYAIAGTSPGDYQGPVNTFSIDPGAQCTVNNQQTMCFTSGTVNFTTAIPPNGSTWFALEGSPQSLVATGQTVTEPLNPNETDFNFTSTGDTTHPTIQKIVYTNSGTDPTGTTMQVTFRAISNTQFQNLVAGTFAQGSSCMPQEISPNNFSCAVTIALCSTTPSDPTSFAGKNCPQSSAAASSIIGVAMKYFTNAFGDPNSVPTPGYLAATDNALNCGADTGNTCRQLHNIFTGIAEDCCTTSGGTKSFNSLFVPVSNLQTWYQPAGTMCNGDAGHQILQPVNADGTSVWKAGRTIPLKFRVCSANGVSVGTAGVITNFQLVSIAQGTVVSVVDETVAASTVDNGFRFDPTGQQWIFNLSTKGFAAPATYVYQINLNDGTQINFQFGLR